MPPESPKISTAQIQQLREQTGAGIIDCKRALEKSHGDFHKARRILRDQGILLAAQKGQRSAHAGAAFSYIHAGGRIGVLLELHCETDFVAQTGEFQSLGRELCMQVAAMAPQWVTRDQVAEPVVQEKMNEFQEEALKAGKPAGAIKKIAEGKMEKFYESSCLLEQIYIRDPEGKKRARDLVHEAIAKLGENIVVRRFARFQVGAE